MIGIFDSGSGGLTVLQAIRNVLPSADVLYFADIKHAPYGTKERDELTHLTVEAMELLTRRGAHKIVSACNSVSASLAISLHELLSIAPGDLIEMVGPTVSYFRGSNARLLLVATPATVRSKIYQDAFHMIGKEARVVAIPDLAGAIEFGAGASEMREMIRRALQDVDMSEYDALLLCCTHYPLVLPLFQEVLPASFPIFDPAIAVAERVLRQFWPQEVANGKTTFLLSQDSAHFRAYAAALFPTLDASFEILE